MSQKMDSTISPLPEGSLIGLVGGGQLGMFFTQAAQKLGYRVCCFCNHKEEPAARYADEIICAPFSDQAAIESLCSKCEVVTYEFESIPPETLAAVNRHCHLMPSLEVVQTSQDRSLEKAFLSRNELPTADFAIIESVADLKEALSQERFNGSAVLKTARDGYDGKGQWKLRGDDPQSRLDEVWQEVADRKCTLERLVDLKKEVSVVVAGDQHRNIKTIGPIENHHVNHILDQSWIDHSDDAEIAATALELATKIAKQFGLVGTLCVEFFVESDGTVLVNEIAPRPHNSGHLTIDAFSLSQFDLQALAVSGYEISDPVELKPAVMINLLGDLWLDQEPDFDLVAKELDCEVFLHLYGKTTPRAGRKMGHVTLVAEDQQHALDCADRYRKLLRSLTANQNS